MQSIEYLSPIAWGLLGIIGLVGLVALVSPKRFSSLTRSSSYWVDTDKIFATLDTRVDVDKYILPFSRQLGIAVLISVAVIVYMLANH